MREEMEHDKWRALKLAQEENELHIEKIKGEHEKMIQTINENNDRQMEKKLKEHEKTMNDLQKQRMKDTEEH